MEETIPQNTAFVDESPYYRMVDDFIGNTLGYIYDADGEPAGFLADARRTEATAIRSLEQYYGFSNYVNLGQLKKLSRDIREQIENPSVPWLKSSVNTRYSFIYREDLKITGDDTVLKAIRENPSCRDFMKPSWLERFNLTLCCDGNVFLVKNRRTDKLYILPLEQITECYLDEDNHGHITYIRVSPSLQMSGFPVSGGGGEYAVARHGEPDTVAAFRARTKERNLRLEKDLEFYHFSSLRSLDQPLATPILMLSTLYTAAAARLLADTSRYKHAVSLFAVKLQSATKTGAKKGVEEIATASRGGGLLGMTADYNLTGVSSNGLNISNTGAIEFLAPAAASMNIPVTQYSMTVMGVGGTAGSTTTLDGPRKAYYASQQAITIDFFKEILGEDCDISFRSDSQDSVAKNIASVIALYTNKLIHQDEARAFGAEALNVDLFREEAPDVEATPPDGQMTQPEGENVPAITKRDSGHDNEENLDGTEV